MSTQPPGHHRVPEMVMHIFPTAEPDLTRLATLTPDAAATAADLLETWRRHMPVRTSEDGAPGDWEDFWEMAARLHAGLHSGASRIWLRHDFSNWTRKSEPTFVHDVTPTPVSGPSGPSGPSGHRTSTDDLHDSLMTGERLLWGPIEQVSSLEIGLDRRADRYHREAVFHRYANREVHLAAIHPDDPSGNDAAVVMAQMARSGHTKVVVKHNQAKHGIWVVKTDTDAAVNDRALMDALDWSAIHLEGRRDALTVQEFVEMRYEYRVFVVDGVPVTGAGCIEEFTPLDRTPGSRFSTLVRAHRSTLGTGPDTSVEDRPEVTEVLREFATRVACDVVRDAAMPVAYVVDVAMSQRGPLVVEFNGYTNAGLYASDPWAVASALVTAASTPAYARMVQERAENLPVLPARPLRRL